MSKLMVNDWQRVIRWISDHRPMMQRQLMTLCDQNSYSGNLQGLHATAKLLQQIFEPLPAACQPVELVAREVMEPSGERSSQATGPALMWTVRPDAPRQVLLAIHYDTVYPADGPLQRCRWLDERRLNGPGVIDAKGGIVCLLWSLLGLEHFGWGEGLGYTVVLNPDEEVGSPSTWPLWQRLANSFDFAMLFEPKFADGSWVARRMGSGNFHLHIQGRAAHVGRQFIDGRNAITHAARMAVEIDQWNGQQAGLICNVGRMQGGSGLNVVPERASLSVNVRAEDQPQQRWAEERLQALVASYHRPDAGFSCQLAGGFHAPPKTLDDATRRLQRAIERVANQLDQAVHWRDTGGASDGNKLAQLGLPTIDTFGPIGDLMHSPDEWLLAESLPQAASLSACLLASHARQPIVTRR